MPVKQVRVELGWGPAKLSGIGSRTRPSVSGMGAVRRVGHPHRGVAVGVGWGFCARR